MNFRLKNILIKLYGEPLILILVLFGLLGPILETSFVSALFFLSDKFWFGFLINIIFLNTLHALISYKLLRYNIFKQAVTRNSGFSFFQIALFGFIMFLAICTYYFVIFNKIKLVLPQR